MSGLVQMVRGADPSARVLILAHRRELLEQSITTAFRMFGAGDVGVFAASLGRKDRHAALTVASIQSLSRDPYAIGAQDMVLVDEAHLVPTDADTGFRKTLQAMHAMRPSVAIVGLTATPYRLGSGMLHDGEDALFKGIAYEVEICQLLAEGYLCPVRPRATAQRLATTGVAVRGDYVPAQLAAAVDVDATTKAIVRECVSAFAERNCWLVFAVSVEHCEHLAAAFNNLGVPSAAIHGSLSASERSSVLAAYKFGHIRCAITCELLTTGFDHPQIDAIALARPTKSPGLYYQMVGRGFRPHPSKVDCVVLDFAENVLRHGPVDTLSQRITSRAKGDGPAPAKECVCGALLATGLRTCPECGHAFPEPAPPPLQVVPSARPLLSTDVPEPVWEAVDDVQFSINTPRSADKKTTLRVDYFAGYSRIASEWHCFDHPVGGFARNKAVQWWVDRFPDSAAPSSVDEAFEWLANSPPMHYTPTRIKLMADGDYQRVVGYDWPSERDAWLRPGMTLPHVCWTCRFMCADGVCRLAQQEPPEEIQLTGCEQWQLMQDADDFARAMQAGGELVGVA